MLMSLQLIYGPSGSGKSYTLYKKIIEQSIREPDREFIVIVPEQFTMQTQPPHAPCRNACHFREHFR